MYKVCLDTGKAHKICENMLIARAYQSRLCSFTRINNLSVWRRLSSIKECPKQLEFVTEKSKHFDPYEIIASQDLHWIHQQINENQMKLSYDEIAHLVREFGRGSWKEFIDERDFRWPLSREEKLFEDIINCLRNECIARLSSRKVADEKFISLANDKFQNVFELCHFWIRLEKFMRKKKSGIRETFPNLVINKIGDSETGASMAKFKHFTKDGFVSFCCLVRNVNLIEDFHSYYLLVKFVDLFDQMNEKDIGEVCQTIHVQQFFLTASHPLNDILKTKLLDFLVENISTVSSPSLQAISVVLVPGTSSVLAKQLHSKAAALGTRIAGEERFTERHSVRALLALANMLKGCSAVERGLVDGLVERVLAGVEPALQTKDMAALAHMVTFLRDTPRGRMALLGQVERAVLLLGKHPTAHLKSSLQFCLHLAHLGLHPAGLLRDVFTAATAPTGPAGDRRILPELKFAQLRGRSEAGMERAGGDLLALQGVLDLEWPAFPGPRVTAGLEENTRLLAGRNSLSPLEVRAGVRPQILSGYLVARSLEVYDTLCELYGSPAVWETTIIPFFGVTSYVVRLDGMGRGLPVTEEMRSGPGLQAAAVPGLWLAVWLAHPQLHYRRQQRTGPPAVVERLLRRLGYTPLIFDLVQWEEVGPEQRGSNIARRVTKLVMQARTLQTLQ